MKRGEKIKADIDLKNYIESRSGKKFNHAKKIHCPLHEDRTPSFALTNKSQWYCYGCDVGGSIIDFVMALDGVDFPAALDILDGGKTRSNGQKPKGKADMSKAPAPPAQKPGRTTFLNMQAYANKKYNVSVKVFEKWGCKDTTMDGNPAMVIPTVDGVDRLRNLGASGTKYKPAKSGVQAQWFGLKEAQERSVTEHIGKSLVLSNGQTSTMVAHEHGVPAFCKTDGENVIPQWLIPELVTLLTDGWKLFVALDCDNDGKGHAVAQKIIMQLYQYKPVFVDLGGRDGYDLADHCMKYKDKSWDMLNQFIAPLPVNMVDQAVIDINSGLRELAQTQRSKDKDKLPLLVDQIESRLQVIKSSYEVPAVGRDPVAEAYEMFQASQGNPQWITGLRTGITQQDYRLGGLNEGIYTWVAETGMGKTTLMTSMAAYLLGQAPGLIEIGEASDRQIINRLVGYLSHVPWKSLQTGLVKVQGDNGDGFKLVKHTPEQVGQIQSAYLKLKLWKDQGVLNLRDRSKPNTTTSLQNQLRVLCQERGVKWAIMESVDNIPTPGADSEYARISQAMFAFEEMATENGIPILTSSQAGRNTKGRSDKVIGIHDPLGSNHVEGKSYAMMSIYNHWLLVKNGSIKEKDGDEEYYPLGTARIYVKKSRDDDVGNYVEVKWEGGIGFYGYSRKEETK